jgi:hypothetical protein
VRGEELVAVLVGVVLGLLFAVWLLVVVGVLRAERPADDLSEQLARRALAVIEGGRTQNRSFQMLLSRFFFRFSSISAQGGNRLS